MRILYAPSSREMHDDLHCNVACGFDVCVLETLLKTNAEVIYMPHIKSNQNIKDSIKEIFKDSIKIVKSAPKNINLCVSDISSIALKYALWTQNPSVLCLFGYVSVSFLDDDRYFALINAATHCVYSLKELELAINNYPKLKNTKIQDLINGNIV